MGARRFDDDDARIAEAAAAVVPQLLLLLMMLLLLTTTLLLLLLRQRIEPHSVEKGAQSPLNLLPADELFVHKRRVSGGELKASMQGGVDVGRLDTLTPQAMHVGQRVESPSATGRTKDKRSVEPRYGIWDIPRGLPQIPKF